jgi:hypothetical protein
MRLTLAAVLLLPFAAGAWSAEGADAPKTAVNTVCPIDGKKIDPRIPPVAGKTKEGKVIGIGACSAEDAKIIAEHPELYADDAVANRKHQDKDKK